MRLAASRINRGRKVSLSIIPTEARGIQLCKLFLNELRVTEQVMFEDPSGVELTLRRAAISGRVSFNAPLEDHWADILDAGGDILTHVSLDHDSFKALKGHWMRCKYLKLPA